MGLEFVAAQVRQLDNLTEQADSGFDLILDSLFTKVGTLEQVGDFERGQKHDLLVGG
jgi:hypothetical protein